jgi:hypothetical protein
MQGPNLGVFLMTCVANIIISVSAVTLLPVGIYLAVLDRTATTGAVLGFAFLFVVLLVLAKFKHIKGFGFEAEMWDQKQIEAAVLVGKLKDLATLTSEQVALISAKLGLWGSAPSNPELLELMKQTDAVMQATDISKNRRDEILTPLRERVALNYWEAALRMTDTGFRNERQQLDAKLASAVEPERSALAATIGTLEEERGKFRNEITYAAFKANPSLVPFVNLAKSRLASHDRLIQELGELQDDLVVFQHNRVLRRDFDLSSLREQSTW